MKSVFVTVLLGGCLAAAPARAQAPATPQLPPRAARLQPLFGGLNAAQATALLGAGQLDRIAASFASREEASAFFSTKGYEYLNEQQPDTAAYRFNVAWLLNPRNADAYRGLGIVASRRGMADAAIALLAQGVALAPADAALQNDLGTAHLVRFAQTHKKKDLATGQALLLQATAADPTNAGAWQHLAQAYAYQERYADAWAAVHRARSLDMSSLDFALISDLLSHQPDPQAIFK